MIPRRTKRCLRSLAASPGWPPVVTTERDGGWLGERPRRRGWVHASGELLQRLAHGAPTTETKDKGSLYSTLSSPNLYVLDGTESEPGEAAASRRSLDCDHDLFSLNARARCSKSECGMAWRVGTRDNTRMVGTGTTGAGRVTGAVSAGYWHKRRPRNGPRPLGVIATVLAFACLAGRADAAHSERPHSLRGRQSNNIMGLNDLADQAHQSAAGDGATHPLEMREGVAAAEAEEVEKAPAESLSEAQRGEPSAPAGSPRGGEGKHSNILPVAVTIKEETMMYSVTLGFMIAISAIVGLCCAWQAFLLYSIWKHRANMVMQAAQAPFLALLVLSSFLATASSVFFMPINDAFCNLRAPMVLIPGTLMGAIMVGRLWRAHCVLSSVLSFGLDGSNESPTVMNFLSLLADWNTLLCIDKFRSKGRRQESFYKRRSSGVSIRAKVTSKDLMRLIVGLTLPQCILQIIKVTVWPERINTTFNEANTVGWDTCTRDGIWLSLAGFIFLAAIFQLAILVSWFAGDLPSVFNEKQSIFKASWMGVTLLISGGGILLTAESNLISPSVLALLWTILISWLCFTFSWLLVMPKLEKIWSGEQVILSNLIKSAVHSSQNRSSIYIRNELSNTSMVVDPPKPPNRSFQESIPNGHDVGLPDEATTQRETSVETVAAQNTAGEAQRVKDEDHECTFESVEISHDITTRKVSLGLDVGEHVSSGASSIGNSSSMSADSFDIDGIKTIESKMQVGIGTKTTPAFLGRTASSAASMIPPRPSPTSPSQNQRLTSGLCPSSSNAFSTSNSQDLDPLSQLNQIDLSRNVTTGAMLNRSMRRRHDNKVRLSRTSAPPKGLEVRLLKMREAINKVTTATLEGRQAPLRVWKTLQMDATALSSQLQNVEFDWDEEEEGNALKNSWQKEAKRDLHNLSSGKDAKRDMRQILARSGDKFSSMRSLNK